MAANLRPLRFFLRAHRAAGRHPFGFSLHPLPLASGPRSPAARQKTFPLLDFPLYCLRRFPA